MLEEMGINLLLILLMQELMELIIVMMINIKMKELNLIIIWKKLLIYLHLKVKNNPEKSFLSSQICIIVMALKIKNYQIQGFDQI